MQMIDFNYLIDFYLKIYEKKKTSIFQKNIGSKSLPLKT